MPDAWRHLFPDHITEVFAPYVRRLLATPQARRQHDLCARRAPDGPTRLTWDANFRDVDTDERLSLSGPKRDRTDAWYGHGAPTVDDDARADYEAFLDGAPLPGREHG